MIVLQHIWKQFHEKVVLKDLSLDIPDESRMCIVGGSGAGKSVLAKLILGLIPLDRGQILIDGQSIQKFGKEEWEVILDQFGVVFQGAALFDSLTIRENVGIKLYEKRQFPPDIIRAKVIESLQRVRLGEEILDKFPSELSGGMRKRVGISRAIIHGPRYLIYDEPTTGLDPVSAGAIDELILELSQEAGRTSLIITHDLETVRTIATAVAMIHQGQVGFQGSASDFFSTNLPMVQAFLARG
ncbi:MAG: ATP-binding cassette domain-containing protein [Bacteroidota bacterium]